MESRIPDQERIDVSHCAMMESARFSIGIDLGTTNCALAFVPLDSEARSQIFGIQQWDTSSTIIESSALPSFLYLPDAVTAAQIQPGAAGGEEWVVGRLARKKAAESPGRVVSIQPNPGFAIIHRIARRAFCPGDRRTSRATARYHRYAPPR